jgi:hypothetical protein
VEIASLWRVGAHIMGPDDVQQMAEHWPNPTDDYAAFMNRLPRSLIPDTSATSTPASATPTAPPVTAPAVAGSQRPGRPMA